MTRLLSPILDAQELIRQKYACACDQKVVRKRVIKSGGVQYVHQCVRCGEVSLQALPRQRAFELCGGKEPPDLDTELRDRWRSARRDEMQKAETEGSEQFWTEYNAYLQSPKWAEKRRLVFKRSGGMCEGCAAARATDIHHTTYDHRYDEFLFELVAVCRACHERIHPDRLSSQRGTHE